MREQWQKEQADRCPCRGSDDMCPCQNVRPGDKPPSSDELLDWMTYNHLPLELFREDETGLWVVVDTSKGHVLASGETTTDALAEAKAKQSN